MLGGWMERGEVPADFELMGGMAANISYWNTKNYFFA